MVPPLTFGVELEFSLASLRSGRPDPHPEDPREVFEGVNLRGCEVKEMVNQMFIEAGLKSQLARIGELSPFDSWCIDDDVSVKVPLYDPPSISEGYEWLGIEVQSPVFYFCEENLRQVELACRVITASFRCVNFKTSGLHVHVGNGKNGFHLRTMQKLLSFLWTFGPQIDLLHTRSNVNYASSFRKASTLFGKVFFLPYNEQTPAALKIINEASRISDLSNMMFQDAGACVFDMEYRFQGLSKAAPRAAREMSWKKTIEWRQHAGTLEPEAIVAWIRTTVGLMDFARTVKDAYLQELIAEVIFRESEGEEIEDFVDVLSKIGLQASAVYYRKTRGVRKAIREGNAVIEDLPNWKDFASGK